MDQTDRKILSLLHDNARMSVAELSRIVAMSQPAVTERIRKLEEQGVITGYRVELSPTKLGKYTTAFIMFKTNNCKDFVQFAEESPEVIELHRISGEYNFLLKIVSETTETLAQFLDSCSAYGFSTTLIVLATTFEDKSLVFDPQKKTPAGA
ncbi:Lrp/AsnC family transcriptional regulator [Paenibacillus sp. P25]|nr:Lrp/AsnC family transcriptional regulator [Paenibacillus sp. P25]